MSKDQVFRIDIDSILNTKAGKKARYVPRFVRNWLKRIAHQDEINEHLAATSDIKGVPWLDATVKYLDMQIEVHGLETLPDDSDGSRFTFVSNHPLGGPDGIALGHILGNHYDGRIRYLVNDLLMNLPGLAPLCIPINKTGKQSRDLPRLVEAVFQSDNHVIMFPAGLCSRKIQGVIQDLPWNKTFIQKSIETQRTVVPIFFSGQNSERFYRIASWCKRLGLKVNLAMLFLSDETFLNKHRKFDVYIGQPIPYTVFDATRRPADWADFVRSKVYELPPKNQN